MNKKSKFDLTRISETALKVYIGIISVCALVLIGNLIIENVGISALSTGTSDEKWLFILSVIIILVCVISVIVLVLAIKQKRDLVRKEEELKAKKKAEKLARKQAKNRK